ncbi:hypothetical protein FHG87_012374 [Trinorchestia longiramus]|nr:hypothetical protein FHG87_012374 [Trinorchestia longiramus]
MKYKFPFICNAIILGLFIINTVVLSEKHESYEILMLVPFSPRSHRSLFVALAAALTERRHKVTMLSGYDPADHNPDVRYIKHSMTHLLNDRINIFKNAVSLGPLFEIFEKNHREAAKKFYDDPKVRELYNMRTKFI